MGVDMKVKAIYDSEIGNITRSEKNWKDVLKVAGQLYRYEFDNIVIDVEKNENTYVVTAKDTKENVLEVVKVKYVSE